MEKYKLYCLGSRGSWPVEGHAFNEFGGNTSCYVLKKKDYALVIDCGTGLYSAKGLFVDCKKVDVILTHVHYDHILGLLDWSVLPNNSILTFYGNFKSWFGDATLNKFFTKPFWPVEPNFAVKEINEDGKPMLFNDELNITFYSSNHPNFAKQFIVEYEGNKMVVMFDNEKADSLPLELVKDANILIYDGMYTDEIYPKKKGYGHSTYQEGVKLALRANPNRLIITHHDPMNEDVVLNSFEKQARADYQYCDFARAGQTWDFPLERQTSKEEIKNDNIFIKFSKRVSLILEKIRRSNDREYYILYYTCLIVSIITAVLTVVDLFIVKNIPVEAFIALTILTGTLAIVLKRRPKSFPIARVVYEIGNFLIIVYLFVFGNQFVNGFTWFCLIPILSAFILGIKRGVFAYIISEIFLIVFLNTDVFRGVIKYTIPEGINISLPILFSNLCIICLIVQVISDGYKKELNDLTRNQEEIIQKQIQELRDQNYSLLLKNNQIEMRNKLLKEKFGDLSDDDIVDELNNKKED